VLIMLMAIGYRVSITCPECAQQNPVNHLRARMLCPRCQASTELAQHELTWWTDSAVGEFATRIVLKRPEGELGHMNTSKYRVEFVRGPANCPGCRRSLRAEELAAAAAAGTFQCGACAHTCGCRAAEPSLVQRFGYARWLLGEAPDSTGAPQGSHPVVMACMSCGAGLDVNGTSRTIECTYCKASNYLPDGLWLRLHPVPRLEWFYLILDIDEASFAAEQLRVSPFDGFLKR
jgi:hypothetical protein